MSSSCVVSKNNNNCEFKYILTFWCNLPGFKTVVVANVPLYTALFEIFLGWFASFETKQ